MESPEGRLGVETMLTRSTDNPNLPRALNNDLKQIQKFLKCTASSLDGAGQSVKAKRQMDRRRETLWSGNGRCGRYSSNGCSSGRANP